MPKQRFADYEDELAAQRSAWDRKPALRSVYHAWYERLVQQLSPLGPTVEIGGGSGNFTAFFPSVVSTDVIPAGSWLNCLADARRLPFADASVGNFVLVDVLHHLPRPFDFLRDAQRALRPGGRLVILEPAATIWSRLVLGLFHHEPLDLQQDVLAEDGTPPPPNEGFTFANQALAHLLFVEHAAALSERVPGLSVTSIDRSDFAVYPATGGFSYFCLVPARWAGRLQSWEDRIVRRTGRYTAMRLLIVLERGPEPSELSGEFDSA